MDILAEISKELKCCGDEVKSVEKLVDEGNLTDTEKLKLYDDWLNRYTEARKYAKIRLGEAINSLGEDQQEAKDRMKKMQSMLDD